jgi:predicted RNA-binding protein with PIN domain
MFDLGGVLWRGECAMEEHWIFDGYNVMYALGYVRNDGPSNWEMARRAFVALAEKVQLSRGVRVTVVFDNLQGDRRDEVEEGNENFRVCFSDGKTNADNVIAEMTQSSRTVVVTADCLLRAAVVEKGGIAVSPENFLREYADLARDENRRIDQLYRRNSKRFYTPFADFHFDP